MPSDWQSIETAPKDGTEILAVAGDRKAVVYWDCNLDTWASQEDGLAAHDHWLFTHWMALPDGPEEARDAI